MPDNRGVFHIGLDWIPPASLRGNSRTDRRTATTDRSMVRQSGRDHARILMNRGGILGPIKTCEITYTVWHSRANIDLDNLLIGYKAFVDGLEDAGLIERDSAEYVHRVSIQWGGKAKRGESRTRVEIVVTGPREALARSRQ